MNIISVCSGNKISLIGHWDFDSGHAPILLACIKKLGEPKGNSAKKVIINICDLAPLFSAGKDDWDSPRKVNFVTRSSSTKMAQT